MSRCAINACGVSVAQFSEYFGGDGCQRVFGKRLRVLPKHERGCKLERHELVVVFEAIATVRFLFIEAETVQDAAKIFRCLPILVGRELEQDVQGDGSNWDCETVRVDDDG